MADDPTLVFLDANVLARPVTRTLLLVGADQSGLAVTWSAHVEAEAPISCAVSAVCPASQLPRVPETCGSVFASTACLTTTKPDRAGQVASVGCLALVASGAIGAATLAWILGIDAAALEVGSPEIQAATARSPATRPAWATAQRRPLLPQALPGRNVESRGDRYDGGVDEVPVDGDTEARADRGVDVAV